MYFYIVNSNGILPVEYHSYEGACADCDPGEVVFIADNLEILEESLDDHDEASC